MNHISISFAGDYRPLHIESQEMADCVKSAIARCNDEPIKRDLQRLWVDWKRHAKKGLSCASLGADASRYSVVMRRGQRDPWLDRLTGKFPQNPQIKY